MKTKEKEQTKATTITDEERARVLDGADFDVERRPSYYMSGGKAVEIPSSYVTVRKDNEQVLGVVGGAYKVVDHRSSLLTMAETLKASGYNWAVKNKTEKGRVYTRFTLDHVFAPPKDKKLEGAKVVVSLVNSYDGTRRYEQNFGVLRQICSNGMWGFATTFALTKIHTKSLDAERAIGDMKPQIQQTEEKYLEFYSALSGAKAPTKDDLLQAELPPKLVNRAMQTVAAGQEQDNAWGMYNAFTQDLTRDAEMAQETKRLLYASIGMFFMRKHMQKQLAEVRGSAKLNV